MKALLRTDGGARPRNSNSNPGHAGIGVVLKIHTTSDKVRLSRYIGKHSNNYAEYTGLRVGLVLALEQGVTDLAVVLDSQLVVKQVNKEWRCKDDTLRPILNEVWKLMKKFEHIEITWDKRDKNHEADTLCTAAIQYGRNKNIFIPQEIKEKRGKAYIIDPFQS